MERLPDCPDILIEHPDDLRDRADEVIMYHSFVYQWAEWMDRYDYEMQATNREILDVLQKVDDGIDAVIGVQRSNGMLAAIAAAGQMKGEWTAVQKYRPEIPNDIITDVAMLLGEYINSLVEQISGPTQMMGEHEHSRRY